MFGKRISSSSLLTSISATAGKIKEKDLKLSTHQIRSISPSQSCDIASKSLYFQLFSTCM
jgi:hypothetical protein